MRIIDKNIKSRHYVTRWKEKKKVYFCNQIAYYDAYLKQVIKTWYTQVQLLCCGNLMQALNIILSEFDASIDYNDVWIWCKHWLLCCLNLMQALTIISVYFDRCWTRRMSNGTAHMNGPSSGKYIDTIGKWKASPQLTAADIWSPNPSSLVSTRRG